MPIKLDPNSEKPLHIQAEEVLRKLIESRSTRTESYFQMKFYCLNN